MSHVIVADLGYGDAGKGAVVDAICSPLGGGSLPGVGPVRTVVRFNGGAQAGHNVVAADGRHHTFAQFGSGRPGASKQRARRVYQADLTRLCGSAATVNQRRQAKRP